MIHHREEFFYFIFRCQSYVEVRLYWKHLMLVLSRTVTFEATFSATLNQLTIQKITAFPSIQIMPTLTVQCLFHQNMSLSVWLSAGQKHKGQINVFTKTSFHVDSALFYVMIKLFHWFSPVCYRGKGKVKPEKLTVTSVAWPVFTSKNFAKHKKGDLCDSNSWLEIPLYCSK